MQHVSTRGEAPPLPFAEVMLAGLARDGGLYVPERWPHIDPQTIAGFAGRPYAEVAVEVIRRFVSADEPPSPVPTPAAAPRERERSPLSQREREIVALVAQGFKNKEMAEKMFISEQTVKNHLHNIFDKLGVSDRLELALYAIHNNLHTGR